MNVKQMALSAAVGIAVLSLGAGSAVDAATIKPTPKPTPKPTVISAAGTAKVTIAVERYRNLLGENNGGEPGSKGTGRREINWDGVPDEFAAPYALPGDFFNAPTAPRARGAVLSTPGEHVSASADSDNPGAALPRFGNVNPAYVDQFKAFSGERVFSPIGSNTVDLTFRVPGTGDAAVVSGFGAVYTDIDRPKGASFEYYDVSGRRLGSFAVPASPQGFSFLGVAYPTAIVARVRIRYGSAALGPNDSRRYDVAVMDDFIYGEPVPA